MKPNNTGEDMWLWAQTVNQNLKQNQQTQDADAAQLCMCYIWHS